MFWILLQWVCSGDPGSGCVLDPTVLCVWRWHWAWLCSRSHCNECERWRGVLLCPGSHHNECEKMTVSPTMFWILLPWVYQGDTESDCVPDPTVMSVQRWHWAWLCSRLLWWMCKGDPEPVLQIPLDECVNVALRTVFHIPPQCMCQGEWPNMAMGSQCSNDMGKVVPDAPLCAPTGLVHGLHLRINNPRWHLFLRLLVFPLDWNGFQGTQNRKQLILFQGTERKHPRGGDAMQSITANSNRSRTRHRSETLCGVFKWVWSRGREMRAQDDYDVRTWAQMRMWLVLPPSPSYRQYPAQCLAHSQHLSSKSTNKQDQEQVCWECHIDFWL